MKIKYLIVLFLVQAISIQFFTLVAQEICNNGVDDDGDGLVDCFDEECEGRSPDCDGFFYPVDPADTGCTSSPALTGMNISWNQGFSSGTAANGWIAGDIDNDGMPEVLMNNFSNVIVLNGNDGSTERTISFDNGVHEMAMADVNNDGFAEIFATDNSENYVECRSYDGNQIWITPNINDSIPSEGYISIADFNFDGVPEVHCGRTIINAVTGEIICTGYEPVTVKQNYSIAADVLDYDASTCPDCDGLELIYRNEVYSVDIPGKSITLRATAPGGRPGGRTGVVDFDQDGALDIVVVEYNSGAGPDPNSLYVWEPRTDRKSVV